MKLKKIGILIDSTSITRDDISKFEFVKVAQLQVEIDNVTYKENQLTDEQMINYINQFIIKTFSQKKKKNIRKRWMILKIVRKKLKRHC